MLGLRLSDMGSSSAAPFMWQTDDPAESNSLQPGRQEVEQDACNFKLHYEREVQRTFSRVQHHWHNTDKDGRDVPMKYCRIRTKTKHGCNCKMGFPRHVPIVNGVIQKDKYRSRVVCPGIAKEFGL